MSWSLSEAKNRFSEVVRLALQQGPQRVERRGEAVVVLSESEFRRLKAGQKGFKAYLAQAPSFEGLDLTRDITPMRDIEL